MLLVATSSQISAHVRVAESDCFQIIIFKVTVHDLRRKELFSKFELEPRVVRAASSGGRLDEVLYRSDLGVSRYHVVLPTSFIPFQRAALEILLEHGITDHELTECSHIKKTHQRTK